MDYITPLGDIFGLFWGLGLVILRCWAVCRWKNLGFGRIFWVLLGAIYGRGSLLELE